MKLIKISDVTNPDFRGRTRNGLIKIITKANIIKSSKDLNQLETSKHSFHTKVG